MKKISLITVLLLLQPSIIMAEEFTVSPAELLRGEQRNYYYGVFNYAMNTTKADGVYHWDMKSKENIRGDIRIGKTYTSKSESSCRNFSESFAIGKNTGKNAGIACLRDDQQSWCILKESDAHTCALENPQTPLDKVIDQTKGFLPSLR